MSDSIPAVGDLYCSLTYNDAVAAIEFLCTAFGFHRRLIVPGPGNSVMHSELTLGNALIMVSSPKTDSNRISQLQLAGNPCSVCVRVDDPDSHLETAQAAGATILQALTDEDFGTRGYMANDLEGHLWYFGTYRPGQYWED